MFLYANSKVTEREMRSNLIHTCFKINKIISNNLIKDVEDLYSENYEELKKEIEEDTNKWKHIPVFG